MMTEAPTLALQLFQSKLKTTLSKQCLSITSFLKRACHQTEPTWDTNSTGSEKRLPPPSSSSSSNEGSRGHTRPSALSLQSQSWPRVALHHAQSWWAHAALSLDICFHFLPIKGSSWIICTKATFENMSSAPILIQAAVPHPHHKTYSIPHPLQSYAMILKTIKNIICRNY